MRRKIDLIILVIVLLGGIFAYLNVQAIGDWLHTRYYTPPDAVVQLAASAGMSDRGKELFYRFEPQIVDQQDLDAACSVEKLGCTEGRAIYILRADTQAQAERNIVTAAHEMLHVAYSRMNQQQIDDLQPLLQAELSKPAASGVAEELKGYSSEDYYNEAHSFIGSELPEVSAALEAYYSQYFSDRAKSTDAYKHSPED